MKQREVWYGRWGWGMIWEVGVAGWCGRWGWGWRVGCKASKVLMEWAEVERVGWD